MKIRRRRPSSAPPLSCLGYPQASFKGDPWQRRGVSSQRARGPPTGACPFPSGIAPDPHGRATPPLRVGRQGNHTGDSCHKLDRTAAITPVGQ